MADNINVRPLQRADVPAWVRMRSTLWPDCPAEESDAEIAAYWRGSDLKLILIAMAADTAVGFAEISERNIVDGCDGGPAAYLEGWFVEPDFRRQGVGQSLIEAAMEWARARGYRYLGSDVELDNQISQSAHEALGFEETGRVVTYKRMVGA